jgi:hypothetical protein
MRLGQFDPFTWALWEAGRLDVSWNTWPGCQYWCGGESTEVESLLVQAEGGYGDIFMMLRWLPLLKKRFGIRKLGLTVFQGMWDLSLGVDEVYVVGEDMMDFTTWQYATSILSLPAAFDITNWDQIPDVPPYRSMYRQITVRKIGFCFRAEQNSSSLNTKSLPPAVAQQLVDELTLPGRRGCSVYSLAPNQKDLYGTGEFSQPDNIIYEPERMATWRETANYIRQMDFVITVDTAVAHLTGLIGVPCLVLLPKSSCWRWGVNRTSGPWYGPQLTYYHQMKPLAWENDVDLILKTAKERIHQLHG